MTKKFLMEKYKAVIKAIAIANNEDLDVAFAMLISSVKNHYGIKYTNGEGKRILFDRYEGIPAGFNYDDFINDLMG